MKEKRLWLLYALIAMFFLYNPQISPVKSTGFGWLILSIFVFIIWGLQAWIIYRVVPGGFLLTGLIIASVAIILLSE